MLPQTISWRFSTVQDHQRGRRSLVGSIHVGVLGRTLEIRVVQDRGDGANADSFKGEDAGVGVYGGRQKLDVDAAIATCAVLAGVVQRQRAVDPSAMALEPQDLGEVNFVHHLRSGDPLRQATFCR